MDGQPHFPLDSSAFIYVSQLGILRYMKNFLFKRYRCNQVLYTMQIILRHFQLIYVSKVPVLALIISVKYNT